MESGSGDGSSTCPICGWVATSSSLQEHLDAHSKKDLIQLLLQQRQHGASSSEQPGRSGEQTDQVATSSREYLEILSAEISESSSSQISKQPQTPHHSRAVPTRVSKGSGDGGRRGQKYKFIVPGLSSTDSLPGGSSAGAFTFRMENSSSSLDLAKGSDDGLRGCADHSLISNSDNVSQSQEDVIPESDNATSQTSIIKYIIDQTGKSTEEAIGNQERWILPDGRAIPIYSSFPQVQILTKELRHKGSELSRIGHTSDDTGINLSVEKSSLSGSIPVNLLTDEEIPPRGEISEYEESNTSSVVSEDSKAALSNDGRGFLISKSEMKRSPKSSKLMRKHGFDGFAAQGHQFLCCECPTVQKFKSLFELIGHKVKVHPSVSDQLSDGINILPSMTVQIPHISPVECPDQDSSLQLKAPKEFFCVYCNVTYSNKVLLSQHMDTDHADRPQQPNIFECNTCGKTFQARTNLRKHLLVHKERKHVCTTCSKGFTSNFKLMEHSRVHTKDYPYKCTACEKSYRTPSLLNHHVKTVHVPDSDKPAKPKLEFYCGMCRKVLRSKRSYLAHTKSHHVTPKKCSYCCETFSRQSVLVRHIRISHDPQYESSESKDCPVCQKKLHPNSMIKHMRIHTNEKPFACQVCEKRFRTYANMASHAWSHTNVEKPFKCKVCPRSYLFKRTLENHMMVHKRRTLHYVCNECGVRFTNKVNMKRHLEEHYSEKKYKCKTCGKAFQRNYYLLEHERIHTGIKPYACNICGKCSTTKSNHRAHIKIHDAREAGSQEG